MSKAPLSPIAALRRLAYSAGVAVEGERFVPEETAVAFTYNRCANAVMMATPADLEDFAVGFSLTEGIIESAADISQLEIVPVDLGIELRMWIAEDRMEIYSNRRRFLAGPTGCGLCGIESLIEAAKPPRAVQGQLQMSPEAIASAIASLPKFQTLNRQTRAVHAAGLWKADEGIVAVREDVGRHNALDKLAGALARQSVEAAKDGAVLLTSRVSVEMVQKTAILGAPILVAVSAPTALAVRTAEACGITLIAIARGGDFEVFTHPKRIVETASRHVA